MTSQTVARRRRPRGTHPKRSDNSARTKKLPEYLEAHEVEAIIRASDNPRAKLLMNNIHINYLSRWLEHSSIQTTLIYLELVPDPSGSLDRVP